MALTRNLGPATDDVCTMLQNCDKYSCSGDLESVAPRLFQIAAGLILATLTPLMELVDRWEGNAAPINDTELNVKGWFVDVGVDLTLAKLMRKSEN